MEHPLEVGIIVIISILLTIYMLYKFIKFSINEKRIKKEISDRLEQMSKEEYGKDRK